MLRRNNNSKIVAGLACVMLLGAGLSACNREVSSAALRAEAGKLQQKGDLGGAIIQLKNALEARPDDAETRYALARVYIATGEAQQAEKEVRRAISLGHAEALTMSVLGKALYQQGLFQKVLDETDAAAAGNEAELMTVRADAYRALGQLNTARQMYNDVLKSTPKFVPALLGLGRAAYVEKDGAGALGYSRLALAAEPRNIDALLFKGDLLRAENQPDEALKSYDEVLAINPSHRSAHVERAYLEISLGKYEAAQKDLTAAKLAAPGSLLVFYTQALLDFSQGKHAEARESLQIVLRAAPEHMPSVLLAGAVDLNLGSIQQAENHLRHYLTANPNHLHARKLLASTLLRSGHSPDALTVLAPALKQAEQDAQVLALAGESYMQARDFNKASEYFGKASDLDPKTATLRTSLGLSKLGQGNKEQAVSDLQLATRLDAKSQQAGMALVRTQLALQQYDEALLSVLALEKEQPGVAAVQDLKGLVHLGRKDTAQARASFEKALQLQPNHFSAVVNLAQLDMEDKQPAKARQHLTAFLERNKGNTEAMNALATLAMSLGNKEEATKWLEQANDADPGAIVPAVRLLTQYLMVGNNQKALSLARNVQVAHPHDPDLLDLLGKSQVANGELGAAVETYRKLAAALPRSAQVQMQIAALQLMQKNTAVAEDHLRAALAIQPDFPAAQLAHAELYARQGRYALALMIAKQLQRNHPKGSAGYQLEGDILVLQRKDALALPVYEQAQALGQSSELEIKIANALKVLGKEKESAARLAQWLKQHPDDVRVKLFQAEALVADKNYAAAAAHLEAMLKQHPGNVPALNNLALAYQHTHDKRAQQVAEQAFKLANEQPAVMDTLGWILVEQGDAERGLQLLQAASARAPAARDIRYHVAMALFKTGKKADARKELEKLVAGNMQFAQADDARALLKQLQ